MDRIQRNGETWQRQPTGEWLRFDVASGQWLAAGSPPPPPPPPPADLFSPYVPLEKPARRGISLDGLRASLAGLDRRIALIGGAALLAVLLVAGGFVAFGGNEPGVDLAAAAGAPVPEPKKLPKKQQFIHEADQICADFMTAMNKMPTPTDMHGLAQVLKKMRGIIHGVRDRGLALEIPKDARKGWVRFNGSEADMRDIDEVIAAAERADVASVQALMERNQSQAKRDRRWAKRYGMKVCSQELS
ncbi:MAG: hypothetical protein M3277_06380 [Actinomycetota bacterium]|nr:hypothetical protein [Actinomycetota bacterium]